MSIVRFDKGINLVYQLGNASKGAPADGTLSDDIEPDFNLIEPGGVRGCVVNVVAGVDREPALDFGMLVCGVVVDDQVDVKSVGYISIEMS